MTIDEARGNDPDRDTQERFGFWMTVAKDTVAAPIRVRVTTECLRQLAHSRLNDELGLRAIFKENRTKIEDAANAKFEREGTDPHEGLHSGMPILILFSSDMPDLAQMNSRAATQHSAKRPA